MTILEDVETATSEAPQATRVKMRMLEQMAEALEDEATGLYYRAASFEEEEFMLNREIGERQTEINRLLLKLEALRSERDSVLEKIESITTEATEMRETVFKIEDEFMFQSIKPIEADDAVACRIADFEQGAQPGGAMFFRRLNLAESVG
jgi:chromosome segregation ATPase